MHNFYEDSYLAEINTIVTGVFIENNQNCISIAENIFYPRGGIHIKNISEIGKVEIKYNSKKGMPTINIKLGLNLEA